MGIKRLKLFRDILKLNPKKNIYYIFFGISLYSYLFTFILFKQFTKKTTTTYIILPRGPHGGPQIRGPPRGPPGGPPGSG